MKFSNNHWELAFQRNTEVEECHDVTNLPYIKYNFVSLDALESLYKDPIWGEFPICDVIGVVKESSPMEENTSEVNHQASKRDLTLVDKMGFSVRVTLWGRQAEQYNDADAHPVIAFKGVKLGDFGGRSLSMFSSSSMQVNPEIEESFSLRAWYDANGAAQPFKAHSS
jgi:replication factor A1